MSDTNFPDEQHKTAFKRLPQAQVLDGGGDWQLQKIAYNRTWICPHGIYELYVAGDPDDYTDVMDILLNGVQITNLGPVIFQNTILWYPINILLGDHVIEWTTAGAIQTATAWFFGGTVFSITASRGWILSGGDVISFVGGTTGKVLVRFRRVG